MTAHRIDVRGFDDWRVRARALLVAGVAPEHVEWREHGEQSELFAASPPPDTAAPGPAVPRAFVALQRLVAFHSDVERWSVGYRVLWRLTHGEHELLSDHLDPDVAALRRMAQQVRRDAERMRAFVRFRRVDGPEGPHYIAWHRPDHHVLPLVAPFFADRFASMRWTVLGPSESASWDGRTLELGPGVPRTEAPADDELEDMWRTYYAAVFNRPRIDLAGMQRHMPKKHWATLPELRLLPALQADAVQHEHARVAEARTPVALDVPRELSALRAAAAGCTACPLFAQATQTVFGEGPTDAALVLVGEQPGDVEDRRGAPFVGPAGQVLDRALAEAGIERAGVYVTNAVKHFKWRPVGKKRRLHQRPDGGEIERCKPWLVAELEALRPRLVVALGAVAGQSLLGRRPAIARERATVQPGPHALPVLVTYHPSAILRHGDDGFDETLFAALVEDLRTAARHCAGDEPELRRR